MGTSGGVWAVLTCYREEGLALSRSALGRPVVCGFWTWCRKSFTAQIQVDFILFLTF